MITGKPAKAVAVAILGGPLGDNVVSVDVRRPTDAEQQQWVGSGLTVGDVWSFEMGGPRGRERQFRITSA